NQSFPAQIGEQFNVTMTFQGIHYYFDDIARNSASFVNTQSVSVMTSYPGENQFLTVSSGEQGVLLYPDWEITLRADFPENYTIMENGGIVKSGTAQGITGIPLTVNGTTVSVEVSLGGKVYSYKNEFVANIPIQKYYGPKPPPLQFTLSQYEYGIARAFVASLFGIFISILSVRKWIIEREKREVQIL
ncbi:hypothetical protein B1B_18773, partial [mine drainage metagenome]